MNTAVNIFKAFVWLIIAVIAYSLVFGDGRTAPQPAAPTPSVEHVNDSAWHTNGTDPCATKVSCDVWHAITDPDDGVPVQPGVPCRQQPTADSETRCILAEHPAPADPNDGKAWCDWQRTIYGEIDVPVEQCTVNGKDY